MCLAVAAPPIVPAPPLPPPVLLSPPPVAPEATHPVLYHQGVAAAPHGVAPAALQLHRLAAAVATDAQVVAVTTMDTGRLLPPPPAARAVLPVATTATRYLQVQVLPLPRREGASLPLRTGRRGGWGTR